MLPDSQLMEIVALSLKVSVTAVLLAALLGIPLGALLAIRRFPGRTTLTVLVNALMGLPPVVVGLGLYLLLSRSGPLGVLQLLYTPTAMIIAQTILVTPIIASFSQQIFADLHREYDEMLRALRASRWQTILTLIHEARHALITAILAGLGRALSEIGAVMIVGGNINHATRVMTTAIALETSKGNLRLAVSLGLILLALSFAINLALHFLRSRLERAAHA